MPFGVAASVFLPALVQEISRVECYLACAWLVFRGILFLFSLIFKLAYLTVVYPTYRSADTAAVVCVHPWRIFRVICVFDWFWLTLLLCTRNFHCLHC